MNLLAKVAVPVLSAVPEVNANDGFNLFKMFESLGTDAQLIITYIAMVAGFLLFAFGIWSIAKAIMSSQNRAGNATIGVIALFVGGFFIVNGFERVNNLGQGGGNMIQEWGSGKSMSEGGGR